MIRESLARSLDTESAGLRELVEKFNTDESFASSLIAAVELISSRSGRVILSGVGKSGHIGRKIAATLASTGTPAYFVHPTEASHGDLGMIGPDDVIICLSWSGETAELAAILTYATRFRVALIALCSNANSTLGRNATVALALPKAREACPHGLAPTTSTILQLAIGDALAIALLESRGFSANDFKVYHPGGKLGSQLRLVGELSHGLERIPLLTVGTPMSEAVVMMSSKGFGVVGIVETDGTLAGIITDGDLRRHMSPDLLAQPVELVMSARPRTVKPDMIASAALEMMESQKITTLFVVGDNGVPVGILHILDLLRAGVA